MEVAENPRFNRESIIGTPETPLSLGAQRAVAAIEATPGLRLYGVGNPSIYGQRQYGMEGAWKDLYSSLTVYAYLDDQTPITGKTLTDEQALVIAHKMQDAYLLLAEAMKMTFGTGAAKEKKAIVEDRVGRRRDSREDGQAGISVPYVEYEYPLQLQDAKRYIAEGSGATILEVGGAWKSNPEVARRQVQQVIDLASLRQIPHPNGLFPLLVEEVRVVILPSEPDVEMNFYRNYIPVEIKNS